MERGRMVQLPPHLSPVNTSLSGVLFICTSIQVAIFMRVRKIAKSDW